MKTRTRALTLLSAAAMMAAGALGAAVPAAATPAQDTITVTEGVATYNATAIANEATATHADNISCGIKAWAAANPQRGIAPGFGSVNGQDAGVANGNCTDQNMAAHYEAFLDIRFEYLQPGTTNTYIPYADGGCTVDASFGQAVFEACRWVHQFSVDDPIQDRARRAVFNLGIFLPDGTKDVRSARAGVMAPHGCAIVFGEVVIADPTVNAAIRSLCGVTGEE